MAGRRFGVALVVSMSVAVVSARGAAAAAADQWRAVSLDGCVQSTADPATFLLAVPGTVDQTVRGLAKGVPLPQNAGAGPAPRSNPALNPPVAPATEPRQREGRYSTPAYVNHTYQLQGLQPAALKPLVGQAIHVEGELPVAGFPGGDAPGSPADTAAPSGGAALTLRARQFKPLAKSCIELMRDKR